MCIFNYSMGIACMVKDLLSSSEEVLAKYKPHGPIWTCFSRHIEYCDKWVNLLAPCIEKCFHVVIMNTVLESETHNRVMEDWTDKPEVKIYVNY